MLDAEKVALVTMEKTIQETKKISQLLLLIRFGVYLLLLTPLVFWKPLDFFFDSTKGFFIIGIIELIFVAYLWLIYLRPEFRPRTGRVGVVFFLYVFILILASVFGVDPFVSFWSNTDRVGGVLLWLHLAALFLIVTSVLRTTHDWQHVFFLSSLVGITVSVIFLLTRLSSTFFDYSRNGSTFGNSTFLGIYLLFCLMFSSILAFTGETKRLRQFGRACILFFLIVLWFTGALAAKYAMVGGLILFVAMWLIVQGRSTIKKMAGRFVVVLLCFLFFFALFQLTQKDSYLHQAFIEKSSGSRFAVWSVAFEAWKERPFLGWGLENFPVAFLSHYDPCFGSPECGGEGYWFDRAHNKVLDTLVEAGVVGLLSYFVLLIASVLGVWDAYRRSKISVSIPILFTTFFAVYFVQSLAEFDLAFSLFFLVIFIAYIHVLTQSPIRSHTPGHLSKSFGIVAGLVSFAFPFVFFYVVIFSVMTNQTQLVVNARTVGERREAYETQVFGSPIGQDYRRVFLAAETVKWILRTSQQERQVFSQPFQDELAVGIQGLSDTVARAPNNLKAANLLGILYQLDAHYFDKTQFVQAERVLSESLAKNPRNQHTYAALSAVYLEQGRVAEALALLQEAIGLYPSAPQSSLRLLAAIRLTADQTTYEQKKAEILQGFPDLEDEVTILAQMWEQNPDQLYGIFY